FNVGIELGQLVVLALFVPAVELLFRFVVAERLGTLVVSALILHTGWHWMIERGAALQKFDGPELDVSLLATAMRWMMVLVAAAGVYWLIGLYRGRSRETSGTRSST
ncbi:MAG TPA: hypothetical protein VIG29_16225, partial [Vicinamibacteria bacterium]